MPSKEDPNDILLVRNIDVDCIDHSTDFLTTSKITMDDDGNRLTEFVEIPYEFDHSKEFQVRWGGQKFRIAPGETRKMPRYIANHYAKYLADHILAKREIDEQKVGLVAHPVERPKVLSEIIIGIDQAWNDLGELDEGSIALNKFEELNAPQPTNAFASQFGGGKGLDIKGEVDAGIVTTDRPLSKETPLSTEEILSNVVESEAENQASPAEFKNMSKYQLVKEIRQLDPTFKLTGKESKNQLINTLKRF